jgi:hypothetical protein
MYRWRDSCCPRRGVFLPPAKATARQIGHEKSNFGNAETSTSAGPTSCGALMVQLHLGVARRDPELARVMPCAGGVAARLHPATPSHHMESKKSMCCSRSRCGNSCVRQQYPCYGLWNGKHSHLSLDAASTESAFLDVPTLSKFPGLEPTNEEVSTHAFSSLKAWNPPARRPT